MRCTTLLLLGITALAGFPLQAKAGPILGGSGNFAVLGATTVTNTNPATNLPSGPTTITGDVGVSPGSAITGLVTTQVNGTIYGTGFTTNPALVAQAQADNTTAYNALAGLAPTAVLTGQNLGGLTLTPGVYFFASSAQLTGALTLNAEGQNNAYWVFQIGSTLTTASASSVSIINPGTNGGSDDGLFWQVGSSATLGTSTAFEGNILALTSITLNTTATIDNGRALAQTGAVTMDTNTISIASPPPNNGPGLSGGLAFNSSGDVVATANGQPVAAVPEPSTMPFALIGGALLGLPALRRRMRGRRSRDVLRPLAGATA